MGMKATGNAALEHALGKGLKPGRWYIHHNDCNTDWESLLSTRRIAQLAIRRERMRICRHLCLTSSLADESFDEIGSCRLWAVHSEIVAVVVVVREGRDVVGSCCTHACRGRLPVDRRPR